MEKTMKRIALTVAVLLAGASPSFAAMNCATSYKDFWEQFSSGPAKGMSSDHVILINRQALRAHDACSSGDELNAKAIFEKIREAAPAKADDFWKQLAQMAPAKQ